MGKGYCGWLHLQWVAILHAFEMDLCMYAVYWWMTSFARIIQTIHIALTFGFFTLAVKRKIEKCDETWMTCSFLLLVKPIAPSWWQCNSVQTYGTQYPSFRQVPTANAQWHKSGYIYFFVSARENSFRQKIIRHNDVLLCDELSLLNRCHHLWCQSEVTLSHWRTHYFSSRVGNRNKGWCELYGPLIAANANASLSRFPTFRQACYIVDNNSGQHSSPIIQI